MHLKFTRFLTAHEIHQSSLSPRFTLTGPKLTRPEWSGFQKPFADKPWHKVLFLNFIPIQNTSIYSYKKM